ncbi:MAG: spinster family MFS transporter [Pyrinomonadaceae bacterium]
MNNKQAAYYALAVLFVINALNFFDRQIIGAVGEPIRVEFGLSDSALGALNTAFTLLYAFVGLPLGKLADKYSRKKILAVGVFVWSLMTAASGLARNFWQIFALRLGVGAGDATCAPAAGSLTDDLFPSDKRGKAMSIFMLGLPVGLALSFAVSGAVAKEYGWRAAFFVAGLPGLLCVLLVLFIREPKRGAVETIDVGGKKREGSTVKLILKSPTMIWLILSGALHNFNMYALGGFITPYLMRHHDLDIAQANYVATIIYGLLSAPGLLLGGFIGDWAKRKRADGALLIATFAILLSIPFYFFSIGIAAGEYVTFAALIGTSVALMYFYYSIVYATIADVTEPASRGTAMAVYFLAMYLLGASLGPYIIGLISDHFTTQAAIAAGITEFTAKTLEPFRGAGLRSAMYLVPILSTALMLVLFAASRTVKKDVEKIQNWMRDNSNRN